MRACRIPGARPRTSRGKPTFPGRGWSSPVVWGDRIYLTSVVSAENRKRPRRASTSAAIARAARRTSIAGWSTAWIGRPARSSGSARCIEGAQDASRHLKNSYASETPVTDGERVYAYFGNVGVFCLDMDGKAVWSQPLRHLQDALRLGHGGVAGAARGPALHRQRQRRAVVPGGARCEDRQADLARRARREEQLGDAVHLGERTSAPRSSPPGTRRSAPTTSTASCFGSSAACRTIVIPTPFAEARPALRRFRLRGRSGAAGVCDPARRVGRHQPEGRARPANEFVAWYQPAGRPVQSVAAGLRRLLLHAARPRILHLLTMRAPARRSTASSASIRRQRRSRRRPGRTTARSSR